MSFSVKSTKWSLRHLQESEQPQPQDIDSYYKSDKSSGKHSYVNQKPITVSDSNRAQGSSYGMAIRVVPNAMEDYN